MTLAATLTSAEGPVEGAEIVFTVAGQTIATVTDAAGVASTTVVVPDHGRSQVVTASFTGDRSHEPSETAATITWGKPG